MDKEIAEKYETFSFNRIPDNNYFAVRVDGRAFHTEVKKMKMKRPLDKKLREAMVEACIEVMKDFQAPVAYTESDEATFLFDKASLIYNRRAEKIASLVAAKMSVEFCRTKTVKDTGVFPIFDGRVLCLPKFSDAVRCLNWRVIDSKRNGISTILFWNFVKDGVSKRNATRLMEGMKDKQKSKMLKDNFGIEIEKEQNWKKMGTVIYAKEVKKKGYNPQIGKEVECTRRQYVFQDAEKFTAKSLRDLMGE